MVCTPGNGGGSLYGYRRSCRGHYMEMECRFVVLNPLNAVKCVFVSKPKHSELHADHHLLHQYLFSKVYFCPLSCFCVSCMPLFDLVERPSLR